MKTVSSLHSALCRIFKITGVGDQRTCMLANQSRDNWRNGSIELIQVCVWIWLEILTVTVDQHEVEPTKFPFLLGLRWAEWTCEFFPAESCNIDLGLFGFSNSSHTLPYSDYSLIIQQLMMEKRILSYKTLYKYYFYSCSTIEGIPKNALPLVPGNEEKESPLPSLSLNWLPLTSHPQTLLFIVSCTFLHFSVISFEFLWLIQMPT